MPGCQGRLRLWDALNAKAPRWSSPDQDLASAATCMRMILSGS
jgi:hypothetical protein